MSILLYDGSIVLSPEEVLYLKDILKHYKNQLATVPKSAAKIRKHEILLFAMDALDKPERINT